MTKLVLALSLLTLSLFPSHFGRKAKNNAVENYSNLTNEQVRQTHLAMFGQTNTVQWQLTSKGHWRAKFELEGEQVSVFYRQDGSYLAHTMPRELSDLPQKLRQSLTSRFPPEQLQEIIAYFSANEAAWFIRIDSGDQQKVYKAFAYGHLTPFDSTQL